MKKIHTHFLECSTADCAICKKLKPLTYIHAKHCTVVPGEQCVIPYCARAKMELQGPLLPLLPATPATPLLRSSPPPPPPLAVSHALRPSLPPFRR